LIPIFAVLPYVGGQPISVVVVSSSRRQRKGVSNNSVLARNGNGKTATERWKLALLTIALGAR